MRLKELVFSDKTEKISFYVNSFLFALNEHFLKIKKLRETLWDYLKLQLFYIGGACQHSGNCCEHMMLISKGIPLDRLKKFEDVVKRSPDIYSRFQPKSASDGTVSFYNCSCLTADRKCSDYPNRPKFCHNYPMSSFLKSSSLHAGCGYKVLRKKFEPFWIHSSLRDLIQKTADVYNL